MRHKNEKYQRLDEALKLTIEARKWGITTNGMDSIKKDEPNRHSYFLWHYLLAIGEIITSWQFISAEGHQGIVVEV